MPRDCGYQLNSLNLIIGPSGEMMKMPKIEGSASGTGGGGCGANNVTDLFAIAQNATAVATPTIKSESPNVVVTTDAAIKSALKANNSTPVDLLRISKMESIMASAHQFSQVSNE